MKSTNCIEFENFDPEDIADVLPMIETSFRFKFGKNELAHVKTFGQLCEIILSKLQQPQVDDCTTQQAFYKIRQAAADILSIDPKSITPDTRLESFILRHNRRNFIKSIGAKKNLLQPKKRIIAALSCLALACLIGLFFNWKYGLAGLLLNILALSISYLLGKEFRVSTVGELAKVIATEHYLSVRRDPTTINRKEIIDAARTLFSNQLDIDPHTITPYSSFV